MDEQTFDQIIDEYPVEDLTSEAEPLPTEEPVSEPTIVPEPEPIPPELYTVYIQTDSASRIIAINSSAFLFDTSSWTAIDEGAGDRYHHAQGNYLPKPLYEERGIPVYKYVDGEVVERTQEEIDADYHEPVPEPSETDLALVELAALESENATRLDEQDAALVELAALITGGV